MKGPNAATIQYVGFSCNHRVMGFVILGFFRKALEISRAKKVDLHFTVPIEAGEKFCELALLWDEQKSGVSSHPSRREWLACSGSRE